MTTSQTLFVPEASRLLVSGPSAALTWGEDSCTGSTREGDPKAPSSHSSHSTCRKVPCHSPKASEAQKAVE